MSSRVMDLRAIYWRECGCAALYLECHAMVDENLAILLINIGSGSDRRHLGNAS